MRARWVIAMAIAMAANARAQAQDTTTRVEEARTHFELGLAHFGKEEYAAALAEFLRAREIYPSRGATKNAAICLRKEGRYDEALEMFERLLAEFRDLSPSDKELVDKEIGELRASIGAVDVQGAPPGATVIVDARERGQTPITMMRVGAGSHLLRVVKDGYVPFEKRFDVAGRQVVTIEAPLQPITRSGRLSVVEKNGKTASVFVDNMRVGATPWQGAVTPGPHAVSLDGGEGLGTLPAAAPVRFDETTALTLELVPVPAILRIDPTPASAVVALDGVTLGRGVWEGRLPAGEHRVEVTEDGFIVFRRGIVVDKDRAVMHAVLDRDYSSPLWAKKHPARFYAELEAGPAIGVLGGDVEQNCTSPCSAGVALGVRAMLHGGYELPSGLGFGIDVGGLWAARDVSQRSTRLVAIGGLVDPGTANDSIALGGVTAGASISFHRGEQITFLARLGAGAFVGVATIHRTGTFTSTTNVPYSAELRDALGTSFLYVAPEVRVGVRFGPHIEIGLGAEGLVMGALAVPRWKDQKSGAPNVLAPNDGLASSPAGESIASNIVVAVTPILAVRGEL